MITEVVGKDMDYTPQHLGRDSRAAVDEVDLIPWAGGDVLVTLECKEFTSLCPITGQPDFGEITIAYVPDAHLVETKSLKLFLMRYRDRGAFNEKLVADIADALYAQIAPKDLVVTGKFNSRGGISITVTASRGEVGDDDA